MKQQLSSNYFSSIEMSRFYEFDVLDRNHQRIGSVTGLWEDQNHRLAFVGVKTSWLTGQSHVVPLQAAQVDFEESRLYLPYEADDIQSGPAFPITAELTPGQKHEVHRYYGTQQAADEPPPIRDSGGFPVFVH